MSETEKPAGLSSYEQFADRYAASILTKPHNAYYDRPNTLSLLPEVAGLHILDAGCGPGVYSEWLLENGTAYVYAIDVTPRMIELAQERLVGRFSERFHARIADLLKPLDFLADAQVDVVICPLVLDYIPDWRVPFREFYRVLKPGGVFVASFDHPAAPTETTPIETYFAVEFFEAYWRGFGEPYPLVKGYRRPLGEVLNPLLEVGFHLQQVLDMQPVAELQAIDPEEYQKLTTLPGFLAWRAVK
jgi:SAM-dependent methyltransferase